MILTVSFTKIFYWTTLIPVSHFNFLQLKDYKGSLLNSRTWSEVSAPFSNRTQQVHDLSNWTWTELRWLTIFQSKLGQLLIIQTEPETCRFDLFRSRFVHPYHYSIQHLQYTVHSCIHIYLNFSICMVSIQGNLYYIKDSSNTNLYPTDNIKTNSVQD